MNENVSLAEMMVADLLEKWPETAKLFHQYNMACVGCVVAPFYSVAEAANIYGISLPQFLEELKKIIDET